ncbi:hypothetical protein KC866_02550 [Patescibacteria group bacterium]|nr:hypothetical protein [Patescibacteria group bacterium]
MEQRTHHRKICTSWYHQRWFRILLVIVGLDMMVLGITLALGLNIVRLIEGYPILRILAGLAYVVVAIFIVTYALSYRRMQKEQFLLCQHCGQQCQ